jgi:hypothetical protein
MGNLKPIGSEKLQGMDKINRILQIARYNEHIPTPINENKSLEYQKVLADGNTYVIVKETNGYIIKKGLNESVADYMGPMKGRKYYSSYSQALKRLNVIAKEVNSSEGYTKNISLFESEDNVEERYFLKMDDVSQEEGGETTEQDMAPAPAPAPAPMAEPTAEPASEMPVDADMGDEDMGDEEDEDMGDEEDEDVSFKMIQKLTGKLAQKIRTFLEDEENEMSSKDIKYVINSIVSAIDLDLLEEDDLDEIISKLEGEEEEGEEGTEEGGEEMSAPEMPSPEGEVAPAPPAAPATGEVAEYGDLDSGKDFVDDIFGEEEDFEDNYGNERGYRGRKHRFKELGEDESGAVEGMIEGLFSESKVDNILKKYFRIDERERALLEEKKKQKTVLTEKHNKNVVRIKNLSETVAQEISSTKLLKKYPNLKFIGKSQQNNLIFENNNRRIKVTPKGSIL